MDDKLKSVSEYLTKLEENNKAERLTGATVVLEMLGYDVQWDMFQNVYRVKEL